MHKYSTLHVYLVTPWTYVVGGPETGDVSWDDLSQD
jgi:hypothetical protein